MRTVRLFDLLAVACFPTELILKQCADKNYTLWLPTNLEAGMEDDSMDEGAVPTFTPTTRIAELNEIDRSVSTLLSAASDAIAILSNSPANKKHEAALRNATSARAAFSTAAETYFSTLSSIEVRLRRQVYALEEAELIKPGDERDSRRGRALGGDDNPNRVGGGPLDSSWLNARASDKVAAGMKRELLVQAREWVEGQERQTGNDGKESLKPDAS